MDKEREIAVAVEGDQATITAPADPTEAEYDELANKLADTVFAAAADQAQVKIVTWAKLGKVVESLRNDLRHDAGHGKGRLFLGGSKGVDAEADKILTRFVAKIYEIAGVE